MEKGTDFIFLSSKITVDSDCRHEIRSRLLLRRKTVTSLDSVLKSRDVTLLTKVCPVQAMVFPVIVYECESRSIKKAEALVLIVMLEKTLERPVDARRPSQSILKEICPEESLEGLTLKWKLQYFGHLM